MTVILSTLTLGTKREIPIKKESFDFKPMLSTSNTVSGMTLSHKDTYYIKEKVASKVDKTDDLSKIDSVANDLNSLDTNMAQGTLGVKIVIGKQMVKYLYPDGSIEIRQGGSLSWRNKNPGALSISIHSIGRANKFAVFASEAEGYESLKSLLHSGGYRNLTLESAMLKYAPPRENNTAKYQSDLKRMTGLDLNRKIRDLTDEEIECVINTIKILEGWRAGNVTYIDAPNKQIVDTLSQKTL